MRTSASFPTLAPDGYRHLGALHEYVATSGLERPLLELVYLRVSQINGCARCLDMHTANALAAGVDARRLHLVAAWFEAPVFTDRERAALGWAEAVTRLGEGGVPDAAWERARRTFTEKEIADLTLAVGLINTWNRINIALRVAPAA